MIKVGKIINTHGVRGELKIQRTGKEDFNRDIIYYIGKEKIPVEIEKSRYHKDIIIIKIKNFDNINDVLNFKSKDVFISKDDLKDLEENEYYVNDLIGLNVYNQDGILIGKLKEVLEYSANDVYVVSGENKEYLVPVVDEFILDIDINNKSIKVKLIEGM